MTDRLNGRLELVTIGDSFLGNRLCNYGNLLADGRVVVFHNTPSAYQRSPCLVRFDLRDGLRSSDPVGYFISSIIPPDFKGLAPEHYALLGLWEKAHLPGHPPTINEVEQVYRPGNTPFLHYIQSGSSCEQGGYAISVKGVWRAEQTTPARFMRLTDPQRASRVILAQKREDLETVAATARSMGLFPVSMEPLRDFG